ncbi:hypothetical protein T01_4523 [Trichinella spiralis]|uniref:Uncharacterized protein n=1 Tax=Trichinella spiralis TaxID=6334 RepID=A0A0V1B1M1_TRISP|nr:hypothetical protein T01_4523 [Trichinella spiralis]
MKSLISLFLEKSNKRTGSYNISTQQSIMLYFIKAQKRWCSLDRDTYKCVERDSLRVCLE